MVFPDELHRQKLLAGESLFWVLLQDGLDELLELPRHLLAGREVHLVSHYFLEILLLVDVERRCPEDQLVGQDSNGPKIDLLVVPFALQQLRGEIEGGAAEGGPEFLLLVDGPAKVAQLDIAMDEHNIFRLDISMQYFKLMHDENSLQQVTNNERGTFLGQLIPI